MNGLPYYKAYPRDFFEGTRGMDGELKGAYRMVLDLIYQHGGRLHNDPGHIAGQLGYSVRKWHAILAKLVDLGKLQVSSSGEVSNYRADKELVQLGLMQSKQRENGSKPKNIKAMPEAAAYPKPNHTEPEPDTERGEAKASLVRSRFSEFWDAYPHRDGKRNKAGAEKAFAKAAKRGVSQQMIIDGARAAHGDRRVRDGYARDPTTWLNQEGWADEIDPNIHPFPSKGRTYGERSDDAFEAAAALVAQRPF
jgi:uncharacterized protein YdaU (DUF1376 family)